MNVWHASFGVRTHKNRNSNVTEGRKTWLKGLVTEWGGDGAGDSVRETNRMTGGEK